MPCAAAPPAPPALSQKPAAGAVQACARAQPASLHAPTFPRARAGGFAGAGAGVNVPVIAGDANCTGGGPAPSATTAAALITVAAAVASDARLAAAGVGAAIADAPAAALDARRRLVAGHSCTFTTSSATAASGAASEAIAAGLALSWLKSNSDALGSAPVAT